MAIKKALQPLHALLLTMDKTTPLAAVLADLKVVKLFEAGKGGFNGTDSFVTVNNTKVGRVCAMTGAVFAHDNNDKAKSYFYKNGSYMIGAEVVKANARKEWDLDRDTRLEALEDQMLEGEIKPKEWKELAKAIQAEEFDFSIDPAVKAQLIAAFGGIVVDDDDEEFTKAKAEFAELYEADEVLPFTAYEDEIKALRDLAPKREAEVVA